MIEALPKKFIGDRAYDPLDDDLAEEGIDMVAPHRKKAAKRSRLRPGAPYAVTCADGSSPSSSSNAASPPDGSSISLIIWALCASPPPSSYSSEFEIASNQIPIVAISLYRLCQF